MKQRISILFLILLCGFAFADGEIHVPYWTDSTLYMVRFQPDGDAFLSDGLSYEVWGTDGHDANDYSITLTESGSSGHYVGNFDTLTNIGAGTYYFDIFVQAGGSPADSDQPAGFWGSLIWTGTAEDRRAVVGDVTAAHSATDAKIETVDANVDAIKAVTDLLPDGGSLTSLATLANQTWLINYSEADTFTDTDTTPWREIIRLKGTTTPITEKELFGTEGEDIVAKTQRIGQIKEPD